MMTIIEELTENQKKTIVNRKVLYDPTTFLRKALPQWMKRPSDHICTIGKEREFSFLDPLEKK